MILLVDSVENLGPSASKRDIEASARAAEWAGFDIRYIEPDFSRCGDAEGALAHIPPGESRPAVWLGYIPDSARYQAIHQACQARGLRLPNAPTEHDRAMELDLAYPRLKGLTPATVAVTNAEEAMEEAAKLNYPLFLKGAVQSLKSSGWKACVVNDESELKQLVDRLFKSQSRTRGKVLIRELLPLRHARVAGNGFPIGREYRAFIHRNQLLTLAYYWDTEDGFGPLNDKEKEEVKALALSASSRLDVPYCAIDLGQTEDLNWWVIETADAQFAGLAPETIPGHWHRLAAAL